MINRPEYLKQLNVLRDKRPIKIITGVRRCGKSTLLELYKNELVKSGISLERIQFIELEDLENESLQDYRVLYKHIKNNLVADQMNYVFLDEVQMVNSFGKVANSLYLEHNVDLYLTGSNSKMLSSNIANEIERETVAIHMLPLSFKEYVSAFESLMVHERESSYWATLDGLFADYLQYSSFPGIFEYANHSDGKPASDTWNKAAISQYLRGIYDKIVLHDIVANKGLSDVARLNSVLRFMSNNIARPEMSINKMSKMMTNEGRKMDTHTLEKYIDAFCDSFILYHANRYDVKGKQQLKTNGKYYLVDIGLRYLLFGNQQNDTGCILENIVYLELCRRVGTDKVWVGKVDNREVDFVVDDPNGRTYYQVSETMRDERTAQREYTSLAMIADHNQKIILTRDIDPVSDKNGIKRLNVLQWLLNT